MTPQRSWFCGPLLLLLLLASNAIAETVTYLPLQSGDDERCAQESAFDAGTVSGGMHLKVGGEAAGCISEWGASVEFDLVASASRAVNSATLVVRKTGYSDYSQGFAYLGAFAYTANGSVVPVERDDLTPDTALSILYPPAANVDLSFDVTQAIRDLLNGGGTRAGLLLTGVYSEIGYEDWISIASKSYIFPPRLIVDFERPIAVTPTRWSMYKQLYR